MHTAPTGTHGDFYAPAMPRARDETPRMLDCLARACRELRERAELEPYEIAYYAGFPDPNRVRRFEAGRAWPNDLDRLISAYATAGGIGPADVWERAVELMRENAC